MDLNSIFKGEHFIWITKWSYVYQRV